MSLPQALLAPPLSAEMADAVARLTQELDASGLWWLSGYAAGLASRSGLALPLPAESAPAQPASAVAARQDTAGRLTIVYGSQTGNARRVAEQLAAEVEGLGLPVRLLRADAYPTRELKHERHLYLVISTQGDGDPPDDARELVDFIAGKRAPRLEHLRYAVLGLGDSSYPQFCAIGQRPRCAARRTRRAAPAAARRRRPRHRYRRRAVAPAGAGRGEGSAQATAGDRDAAAAAGRRRAAAAGTRAAVRGRTAGQPAHHRPRAAARTCAISSCRWRARACSTSPAMRSACGHAIPPRWSMRCSTRCGSMATASSRTREQTLPLRDWLTQQARADQAGAAVPASRTASAAADADLQALLAPGNAALGELARRAPGHRPAAAPGRPTGRREELVAALRPLAPRLYSIASSQKVVGDEAHLTVAHVEYERGRRHALGRGLAFPRVARGRRRAAGLSSSATSASACRPTRRAT